MRRPIWLLLGIALALMLAAPTAASARTIRVHPGDSIQDGVDRARPGDTVLVYPGTYTEAGRPCPTEPGNTCAVVVEDENITIAGAAVAPRDVVLQATGGQELGIAVGNTDDPACLDDPSLRLQGSTIRALTVKGFADDGVFLYCVDGWRVSRVRAIDNVEYGIYPSHSFNGRVDHSFASGANDTGFYIGQAGDSRMDHNTATGNVSGYEVENSTNIRTDHNLATGNTGGILVFALPFLDLNVTANNIVDHNTVTGNNKPNTCVEPGDAVCAVPQGSGILVMASDNTQVGYNDVTGNDSFGIAVTNICVAQNLPPAICGILDIQPDSDGNSITHNTVTGNGTNPDVILPPVFAVDLAWDTTGVDNCWSNNVFGTSFPPTLPAC